MPTPQVVVFGVMKEVGIFLPCQGPFKGDVKS
jgi:hypothetical protein